MERLTNLSADAKKHNSSYRGRFDIIADILDASLDGVRKTHIMYRCNLSFQQLKRYLGFMLQKGLLHSVAEKKESNPGFFEITDKGKKFLKAYKGLKNLMN